MMRMRRSTVLLLALFAACHDATGKDSPIGTGSATAPAAAPGSGSAGSGSGSAPLLVRDTDEDLKKAADEDTPSYVPAEFKAGASRWKDVGVYVDGQPMGFLTFGELPITLQPTWVKDKVSAEKRPHSDDPGWKWAKARFYKFSDYLQAIHVDPKSIHEMHVYGPKYTQSIILKPKDFASPLMDKFMFRFGVSVGGKPIPAVPEGFANGKQPDKIAAVMIYIKKTPPTLDADKGVWVLDGVDQLGVPYYGEPLRGGVRLYLDDKLVAIIKRQELDAKLATPDKGGDLRWKYYEFLKSKGVDTSKIVEAWLVRDERRQDKIEGDALANATFSASAQAKGGVLFGDASIKTNAITMFTRHLKPTELPTIEDDEAY